MSRARALVPVVPVLVALALPAASAHGAGVGTLSLRNCFNAASCPSATVPKNFPDGVAVSPDGRSVYVAALSDDALAIYDRAPDGTLSVRGCVKDPGSASTCSTTTAGLDGVNNVAIAPDGTSVYAVSNVSSTVVAFRRAADGSLTPLGCFDDAGGAATCGAGRATEGLGAAQRVLVSPDGRDVYTGSQGDHSVVRFTRAADGTITPGDCIGAATITCPAGGFPPSPVTEGAFTLSGTHLWVPAGDRVARLDRAADGSLSVGSCIGATGDTGCPASARADGITDISSVALGARDTVLYATDRTNDTLYTFSLSAAGVATYRSCVESTATSACGAGRQAAGIDTLLGVDVTPDGRELLVSSSGAGASKGSLLRFALSPASDVTLPALQCLEVQAAVCPVNATRALVPGFGSPYDLAVTADGAGVAVVGGSSSSIVSLRREVAPICADALPTTLAAGATAAISLRCSDANAEPVSYAVAGAPAHGTTGAIGSDGTVPFTAATGFAGTDAFTFRATDAGGNSSGLGTAGITITATGGPPGGGPPADTTPPRVLGAKVVRKGRLRAVQFQLTESAKVRVALARGASGRRSGRACVKPRPKLKRACVRYVTSGTPSTRAYGTEGARVTLLRKPRAGRYLVTLQATDAAGNRGPAVTVTFTVAARRR